MRRSSLPILTSGADKDYNDEAKRNDEHKAAFNDACCEMARSLQQYRGGAYQLRALVVDGLYLGSTSRLVEDAGLKLKNVDIVSKSVVFYPQHGAKTGRLHTGMLSSFLERKAVEPYDIAVLDFCGGWPGINGEQRESVEGLFEARLLSSVSVVAATFSYRSSSRAAYFHQAHIETWQEMWKIAHAHGYTLHLVGYFRYGLQYGYFIKAICAVRANVWRNGADDWFFEN